MLAKRRAIRRNGNELKRTPLLIPSFSSKGFPEVRKTIQYSSELLTDVALFSAYDLHYEHINPPFSFVEMIFLDSGGYEAARDADLSDYGHKDHKPKAWTQAMHEGVLSGWQSTTPTVVISYDHPKERLTLKKQIERAAKMAPTRKEFIREILLKPTSDSARFLNVPEIVKNIRALTQFDIIGVTEKELGGSILERMTNIGRIRMALSKIKSDLPIHVFGSLDTITTPMYFIAGADIFDGLTWLRFAFKEGQTIYKQNFGATDVGITAKTHLIDANCWNSNYYYMKDLTLEMQRYLRSSKCSEFKYHAELLEKSLAAMLEELGG